MVKVYIEENGLIIRDLQISDTKDYIEMASEGSLSDIFGDCTDCALWMEDWVKEAIQLSEEDNPLDKYLAYSIVCKDNNKLVGSIGCSYYEDTGETGITYFIGSQYRHKGYAASAACLYSRYFLNHYPDIPYLSATVHIDNIPSCKVVVKAGFLLEETKLYKDIYDKEPCGYNFYILKRSRYL